MNLRLGTESIVFCIVMTVLAAMEYKSWPYLRPRDLRVVEEAVEAQALATRFEEPRVECD